MNDNEFKFVADRAEQLALMNANRLTRNSGVMRSSDLDEFLRSASVQGTSDFGAFEVKFGFNQYGQDFVVVQNTAQDGLHIILMADEVTR